jgi:hypothetical protein
MESILEAADSFQEVQDVIARYGTLKATNDDLKASLQLSSHKAEEARYFFLLPIPRVTMGLAIRHSILVPAGAEQWGSCMEGWMLRVVDGNEIGGC